MTSTVDSSSSPRSVTSSLYVTREGKQEVADETVDVVDDGSGGVARKRARGPEYNRQLAGHTAGRPEQSAGGVQDRAGKRQAAGDATHRRSSIASYRGHDRTGRLDRKNDNSLH